MTAFRDASAPLRPAWEYTLVSVFVGDLQVAADRLNRLGAEGWEVVGSVPGDSNAVVYTLKRLRD